MEISYLEKTTMIDYPGKIACTIFLFGCSFRCGFCHNPELVLPGEKENNSNVSKDEIIEFLEKRKNQLEGVCFTGGEPLMTLEKEFLEKIKSMGYSIKIDTNGSFPEKLEDFLSSGLIDFVSMDIKSSPENYSSTAGTKVSMGNIEKSIGLIVSSYESGNLEDYEFRTTVLRSIHDEEEFKKIAGWLSKVTGFEGSNEKLNRFALQGFKNSGKLIDSSFESELNVYEDYLKPLKEILNPYFKEVEIRA